ncbi:YhbY family RNA-binding protein [Providencia rettgeri]|nr:YhbY family RNA-binding protein [Providencia rettgeri]
MLIKTNSAPKSLAHHLNPCCYDRQQWFNRRCLAEIELSLAHRELIKVKIAGEDRDSKNLIADAIVRETGAVNVQIIGKILVIYRPSADQNHFT